jgi:hypothetical protein
MQNKRNLFFAGGTLYLDYRFVAAGGLTRELNGAVATFSTENAAHVHVFDATANDPQGKGGVTLPQDLQAPRLFASVAGATECLAGSIELACEQLRVASLCLEEMIGVYTNEDLLGDIFSTFCIGK